MLTPIITTTTIIINATEQKPNNQIKLVDFNVYRAWQFLMYNITIDRSFVAIYDIFEHATN